MIKHIGSTLSHMVISDYMGKQSGLSTECIAITSKIRILLLKKKEKWILGK